MANNKVITRSTNKQRKLLASEHPQGTIFVAASDESHWIVTSNKDLVGLESGYVCSASIYAFVNGYVLESGSQITLEVQ